MLMLMAALAAGLGSQGRRPADDADLAYWLRNMAAHRYTRAEMASAMGMAESEIAGAMRRLGITLRGGAVNKRGDLLLVLPYPGGRHPRIGRRLSSATLGSSISPIPMYPPSGPSRA